KWHNQGLERVRSMLSEMHTGIIQWSHVVFHTTHIVQNVFSTTTISTLNTCTEINAFENGQMTFPLQHCTKCKCSVLACSSHYIYSCISFPATVQHRNRCFL